VSRPHRLKVVRGHDRPVTALAFSPDGRILASGSASATGGVVVLWNTADVSEPYEFARLPCPVDSYYRSFDPALYALAFSPDGHVLAAGTVTEEEDSPRDLFLWRLSADVGPRQLATFPQEGNVWSVAFSPDGHTLAVGTESYEATMRFYDVEASSGPRLLATISSDNRAFTEGFPHGHDVRLFCLAYSPDGKTLASVANDRIAVLWNTTDRQRPKPIGMLRGHEGDVWSVAFAPDGRTLATRSDDGNILVWDVRNRADPIRLATISGQSGWWTAMAFSPDGHTVLTGGDDADNSAVLWDTRNRTELHPRRLAILTRPGSTAAVFGTGGRVLATGSTDHDTPSLWDVSDNNRPKRLTLLRPNGAHLPAVTALAMNRDGNRLATATLGGQTLLWDVADASHPQILSTFGAAKSGGALAAFTPDGRFLVSAGQKDTAVLWDVNNALRPTAVATLPGHTAELTDADFSSDGSLLALGSSDNTTLLWDVSVPAESRRIGTLTGHSDSRLGVQAITFSPDGRTLATGGGDFNVVLWDVTDRSHIRQVNVLPGTSGTPMALAFSPDGVTLAVGDSNNSVVLWDILDATHPHRLATLTGHVSSVVDVEFSPDGRTLASSGDYFDPRILLWDLAERAGLDSDPLRRACAIAGRGLTPGEWHQFSPGPPYRPTCPG
jgi:WD40 repeat protein